MFLNHTVFNCAAEYEAEGTVPFVSSGILFCILLPGGCYNLFYLHVTLMNKQMDVWLKVLLVNASVCALLYNSILVLIVTYNLVVIALQLDLSTQNMCRFLDYPFIVIATIYLCSVLFIAATLLHRKGQLENTSHCKNVVVTSTLVAMFVTLVAGNVSSLLFSTPEYNDCYCHYILTANQRDLLIRFSTEIIPLLAAATIFCYVYRKSKMMVLDFDIDSTQGDLHHRIVLWKTATSARSLFPWAITHALFTVVIVLVSLAVVQLQEVVSWRDRIVLLMTTLYLHAIDLLLQPLILIRSSHTLKMEVRKLPRWVRQVFFACVFYKFGSDLVQTELSMLNPGAKKGCTNEYHLENVWRKTKLAKAK